ncbi:hypothetical protein EB093_09070 [bacterium]|nr:hypothetical protein [bacterium]
MRKIYYLAIFIISLSIIWGSSITIFKIKFLTLQKTDLIAVTYDFAKTNDFWTLYNITSDSGLVVRKIFGKKREIQYVDYFPGNNEKEGFGRYRYSKFTIGKCAFLRTCLGNTLSRYLLNPYELQLVEIFKTELNPQIEITDLQVTKEVAGGTIPQSNHKSYQCFLVSFGDPEAGCPYNFHFIKVHRVGFRLNSFE